MKVLLRDGPKSAQYSRIPTSLISKEKGITYLIIENFFSILYSKIRLKNLYFEVMLLSLDPLFATERNLSYLSNSSLMSCMDTSNSMRSTI